MKGEALLAGIDWRGLLVSSRIPTVSYKHNSTKGDYQLTTVTMALTDSHVSTAPDILTFNHVALGYISFYSAVEAVKRKILPPMPLYPCL
jgi:hypothetical protein